MNKKKEMMDVYDENKIKTGKVINREDKNKLNNNEYTLCVHCWIINSKKEILISQRSMHMNRCGKWEDTHGGVIAGESSIEGIKRELKEELGINVKTSELKLIKTLKKEKVIRDYYIIKKDILLKDIRFNDNEVMNCKYVTLDEFKEIIKRGNSTFKDFSQTIFNELDINLI